MTARLTPARIAVLVILLLLVIGIASQLGPWVASWSYFAPEPTCVPDPSNISGQYCWTD